MLFVEDPKCTACQKARAWLEARGVAFDSRHIKEDQPTAAELTAWHQHSGLKYKELALQFLNIFFELLLLLIVPLGHLHKTLNAHPSAYRPHCPQRTFVKDGAYIATLRTRGRG